MNAEHLLPSIDAFGRRSWTMLSGHIPMTPPKPSPHVLQTLSVANVVLAAVGSVALLARAWRATPEGYNGDEWWFAFPVDDSSQSHDDG